MRGFGLSCACLVYFLRKSTEFHVDQNESQRSFSTAYFSQLPEITFWSLYTLHDHCPIATLSIPNHTPIAPRRSPVVSCFNSPSSFWYSWVYGDEDQSSSIWTAEAVLLNFFLDPEVADTISIWIRKDTSLPMINFHQISKRNIRKNLNVEVHQQHLPHLLSQSFRSSM